MPSERYWGLLCTNLQYLAVLMCVTSEQACTRIDLLQSLKLTVLAQPAQDAACKWAQAVAGGQDVLHVVQRSQAADAHLHITTQ